MSICADRSNIYLSAVKTPVEYSNDYYNSVNAPAKDFRTVKDCGHSPQYDLPEEFSSMLKEMLNNLTETTENG